MTVFRPCPFCGSTRLAIASDTIPLYAVQCGDCSACGPCAATPDEATSEWNTPGILERTLNSYTKIILDRSNRWREVAEFYADLGSDCQSCPLRQSERCSEYEHEASCREKLFRWAGLVESASKHAAFKKEAFRCIEYRDKALEHGAG